MTSLTVELLRRLSVLALILAGVLLVVPRLLTELGLLGPGVEEQMGAVQLSLDVARSYGSGPESPAFRSAVDELAQTRRLVALGGGWSGRQEARRILRRAAAHAIEAERAGLTARETSRRSAATAGADIDQRLNDLEDLYAQISHQPGSTGAEKTLLPVMKEARRVGAGVLLAIEQGEYSRALSLQPGARDTIESARKTLLSYRQ